MSVLIFLLFYFISNNSFLFDVYLKKIKLFLFVTNCRSFIIK